ncbi:MAG TPA: hypothetical protein VL588_13050, partial [Bdellovibrionota bacterium]|nr:hypothetical protein [Bdellovibrionota bacterium]
TGPLGEWGSFAADRDLDGKMDQWVFWSYLPDVELRRVIQLDEDRDGRVDKWVIEEYDSDPRFLRRETIEDTDHDGKPDSQSSVERIPRWLADGDVGQQPQAEAMFEQAFCRAKAQGVSPGHELVRTLVSALSIAPGTPAPHSGGTGASPPTLTSTSTGVQVDRPSCDFPPPPRSLMVMGEADAAVTDGTHCLTRINPTLAIRYIAFIYSQHPEIHCMEPGPYKALKAAQEDDQEHPAHGALTGRPHDLCGLGEVGGRRVFLNRARAFVPSTCGPLRSTIFHEFLHNMSVTTGTPHDPTALSDGVYACELACFFPASPPVPPLPHAKADYEAACRVTH